MPSQAEIDGEEPEKIQVKHPRCPRGSDACAKITSSSYVGLLNLLKTSQTTAELLRFEDIHYDGFNLQLWPWPLKS